MTNKFRVWDKTKHRWITERVALAGDGSVFLVLPGSIIIPLDLNHLNIQFETGFHDLEKTPIYEGDVVAGESYLYHYELKDQKQFKFNGIITAPDYPLWSWTISDGSGAWSVSDCIHRNNDWKLNGKILGNICEHPNFAELII